MITKFNFLVFLVSTVCTQKNSVSISFFETSLKRRSCCGNLERAENLLTKHGTESVLRVCIWILNCFIILFAWCAEICMLFSPFRRAMYVFLWWLLMLCKYWWANNVSKNVIWCTNKMFAEAYVYKQCVLKV